ncbi:nascent polypeptide-associated complex protein [Candidatus Bathyarchaeota archaeon]|nr:MAG: nascent polypeptide-associated complex protein [Candidatus Bathyarchaeota archaeon]
MMQRMGLSMTPLEAEEVIIKTKDKEIIVQNPEVSVLEVQGQRIFQVVGGEVSEKKREKAISIPEEDVQLVAQQANVSLDQARVALEQAGGDLARAILLLTQS